MGFTIEMHACRWRLMNPKRLTCLSIILCIFLMVRIGLLAFIDIPIVSFFCGLLVPVFGWKRIILIRLGLIALALISNPSIFYSLSAVSEGLSLEHEFLGRHFSISFMAVVFGQAFVYLIWFNKRYKKWLIFWRESIMICHCCGFPSKRGIILGMYRPWGYVKQFFCIRCFENSFHYFPSKQYKVWVQKLL